MKKNLLLTASLLLSSLAMTAQTTSTWSEDASNCAKGRSVYVSQKYSGEKSYITDGYIDDWSSCQLGVSSEQQTEWIVIDLGYNYSVSKIYFMINGDRFPKGFKLYGAASQTTEPTFEDGTDALVGSWGDAILSVDDLGKTTAGESAYCYELSSTGTYRYIKFEAQGRYGYNNNTLTDLSSAYATDQYGLTMKEIKISGTTTDAAATTVDHIGLVLGNITVLNGQAAGVVYTYNSQNDKLAELTTGFTLSVPDDNGVLEILSNKREYKTIGYGTVVVTATLDSDNSKTATATFTLEDPSVTLISLSLPSLLVGNTGTAVVTKYNSSGTSLGACSESEVTLTSSDENVVTVSGLTLTGVAEGSATITATYTDGSVTAVTGTVTVAKNWDKDDALTGGSYNWYASSVREGENSNVVGQNGTFSTKNPTDDTEQWWFVDLGKAYNVKNIGLKQTNTYAAEFEVYTASALKDETAAVSNDNVAWSSSAVATGTCSSDYYTATVALNKDNVRFIKIQCTSGGGLYETYGMAIQRFYLEGTVANATMSVNYHDMNIFNMTTASEKKKAVCTGDWVEETFKGIDAYVIDLTAVNGVPSSITNNSKNPNAIVYASSSVSGENVCTGSGANVANLSLVDGYEFGPESYFAVTSAKYTVELSADYYSLVYCPFNITSVPSGVHLYKIASSAASQITIEEVTSNPRAALSERNGREATFIIKADNAGTYVIEGGTTCGASAVGHDITWENLTLVGSTVKSIIPDGSWIFNNNKLVQVSGNNITLWPFGGYIASNEILNATDGAKINIVEAGETTGLQTVETKQANNDATYNLAGQRVDASYKGIVIRNGKKFINK